MAKADSGRAERAAEHLAREMLGCVTTRRAIRTRFQKVDFFGCDILGKRGDGTSVWLQVTSTESGSLGKNSGNVWTRKKKLERVPWFATDLVLMAEMCREKVDRRWCYFFRLQQLIGGEWKLPAIHTYSIPMCWFKAWREAA